MQRSDLERIGVELAPELDYWFTPKRRRACQLLDAADRALWLLGPDMLPLYKSGVRLYESLRHSPERDEIRNILWQEYGSKANAMWDDMIAILPPT